MVQKRDTKRDKGGTVNYLVSRVHKWECSVRFAAHSETLDFLESVVRRDLLAVINVDVGAFLAYNSIRIVG